MTDRITLTIPREDAYNGIARLVLAGLASRLGLSYEGIEDLELALDGLLARARPAGDVTVSFEVDETSVSAAVGPFDGEALRAELDRTGAGELGLRRILETVADSFEVEERDSAPWVQLRKNLSPAGSRNG